MNDPNDDLDDLLKPQAGAIDSSLRGELLIRTERALSRSRWLSRATKLTAVACVLGAGIAIGWFARPEREVEVAGAERLVPVFVPVFLSVEVDGSRPSSSPERPLSATATELQAEQADDAAEAAKLYRVAGNRFLDLQDYRNATRCYQLFLTRAGDNGLSPEPDDSWLLTSLKNAAFKEKIDEPKIRD